MIVYRCSQIPTFLCSEYPASRKDSSSMISPTLIVTILVLACSAKHHRDTCNETDSDLLIGVWERCPNVSSLITYLVWREASVNGISSLFNRYRLIQIFILDVEGKKQIKMLNTTMCARETEGDTFCHGPNDFSPAVQFLGQLNWISMLCLITKSLTKLN